MARLPASILGTLFAGAAFTSTPRAALAEPPAASAAKTPDLVAKGQLLFDDQRYEESIQVLSAALVRPGNTVEEKTEIYRLLALDYITLNRADEADNAVRGLLVVSPTYQLPASESPRFRDFFAEARSKWEADGRPGWVAPVPTLRPVRVRHVTPTQAEPGQSIELRGSVEDPDARAKDVVLRYRAGSRGEFAAARADLAGGAFRARIPGAAVKPPVIDYYFEVTNVEGEIVAVRGDATGPLRVAVPEPSKGWILPVAIGGGVLGAGAIALGLALAGVFKSGASGEPERTTVTVSVGEAAR